MLHNVYPNIHWVYTLCYICIYIVLQAIYIVLHFVSHNVYKIHVTQCIYMLHNVYPNIHCVYTLCYICIYIVLQAIYIVLHFFVTQCIYKNMLHNVYASKCTTMYIHNVYKMQHNVYTPPYIDHQPKRGYIHCVAFYIHCVAFRYTLQVSIW